MFISIKNIQASCSLLSSTWFAYTKNYFQTANILEFHLHMKQYDQCSSGFQKLKQKTTLQENLQNYDNGSVTCTINYDRVSNSIDHRARTNQSIVLAVLKISTNHTGQTNFGVASDRHTPTFCELHLCWKGLCESNLVENRWKTIDYTERNF